jgi:CBS domain-containing protein
VRTEYAADYLDQLLTRDFAAPDVVTLPADRTLAIVRAWMANGAGGATHQGFPVVDSRGALVGVVTRRDLTDPKAPDDATVASLIKRPPVVIFDDCTLRQAADQMVRARVGRLPVVRRGAPDRVVGILSRSDLLHAHERRLAAGVASAPELDFRSAWWGRAPSDSTKAQAP